MYNQLEIIIYVLEIIGTVEFAISGVLVAIKHRFDLLGVVTTGVITAVGGGILRDILLGLTPVSALNNPVYVVTAACSSVIIFLIIYHVKIKHNYKIYNIAMFLTDTIGLGVFTITGITTALLNCNDYNRFLLFLSGVITAVGGGITRDIVVNRKPEIFMGSIYAGSSAEGALVFIAFYRHIPFFVTCVLSFSATFALRVISYKFKWNLPKINSVKAENNEVKK